LTIRELFISERRYIQNVLWNRAQVRFESSGPVMVEHYAPPRTAAQVRFNNDYFLQFVSNDDRQIINSKAYCAPVLPNTLGVDVFVSVDERTSQPFMTELLGGEAFSMKYFKEHIEKIESRLAQLSRPIELRRTSYCRIFVIENEICFLAFPNEPAPVVRGEAELLCANAESTIACSTDEAGIVYVDGWIRTFVAESDRKLEAIVSNLEK
jgi:hypothetical protein